MNETERKNIVIYRIENAQNTLHEIADHCEKGYYNCKSVKDGPVLQELTIKRPPHVDLRAPYIDGQKSVELQIATLSEHMRYASLL